MPQTTKANFMPIAHAGSNMVNVASPDVCKTPSAPSGTLPIPYPNIVMTSDASDGPTTVKCDGEMPMVKGVKYSKSSGDEAGTAGGVVSGKNRAEGEYLLYSFNVKLEGNNVCRLGDLLFQNAKNIVG